MEQKNNPISQQEGFKGYLINQINRMKL